MTQSTISTNDLYKLLVESVEDYAIFALDPTGHIVSWNAGAQRFKGYTASEIIGQHFSVFYPDTDLAWDKPGRELEIASRVGRLEDEGWRIRKDGSRFWASVVISALRAPDGELVGFAKVTRDLTQRRAAQLQAIEDARRVASEEAMRRAAELRSTELAELLERVREQAMELDERRREADTANRAKSAFLAAMSHELRTPLNAIAGYVELLLVGLRGPLTEEQTADLTRIQRSQKHLLSLINDILNFSRLEAGQVTYQIAPVVIPAVIENVVAMFTPQTRDRQLMFDWHATPPYPVARADEARVEQILLNLLSNAVKFTPPGGHIAIRCEQTTDRVLVHLTDTGPGIPADRQADIFEPFVQLGRSLVKPTEGTGLGLAISRDLARGMGGELIVHSVAGAGATFTLSLPRAPDDPPSPDQR